MNKLDYTPLGSAPLAIIDGDRGENYPQKSEFQKQGYCLFLNTSNVTQEGFNFDAMDFISKERDDLLRKGKLKPNDIVLTTRGTIGNCAYLPEDFNYKNIRINSGMVILRADGGQLDPYFLYCFLRSKLFKTQTQQHTSGSAQPQLPIGNLKHVRIPVRELSEQKRIASVLSALDAKIELNNQINAELERMAKLLYDYWFVQYDFPMSEAQAASLGRPALAGHPYRSSGGKLVPNPTLNRLIPEGWSANSIESTSRLNELVWIDRTAPESLTYVDLANTKNGSIIETTDYKWSDSPSRARRKLRAGDTIIGTVRPGNRSYCLVPATDHPLTGSTGFAVLTPLKDIYREFNYLTLTSATNINRLTTLASGAAYPAVNPDVVASHVIPFPPDSLITPYHEKVKSSFELIHVNQKQNQELTQLRDWLLPLLMNGQVTVQ